MGACPSRLGESRIPDSVIWQTVPRNFDSGKTALARTSRKCELTGSSSRQTGRLTSTTPQLPECNKHLGMGHEEGVTSRQSDRVTARGS
jgi:hypothetical protein